MTYAVRGLGLAASLLLLSTAAVVPQASAQSAPSTAAYVYIQIQGPSGAIYGFNASSTGKLTAIPGAPWKVTGQIVGSNGSQLIALGTDNIHSYAVASNGAIGSQLEQNPYTDYAGGECGTGSTAENSALLDQTGKLRLHPPADPQRQLGVRCGSVLQHQQRGGFRRGGGHGDERRFGRDQSLDPGGRDFCLRH